MMKGSCNWFVKRRSGDTSLEYESRAGRGVVEQNPQRSKKGITRRLNTSQSTVHCHLEKL